MTLLLAFQDTFIVNDFWKCVVDIVLCSFQIKILYLH